MGIGISSWCWVDWHQHYIHIDIHKTKRFNRLDRGRWNFDRHVWRHEPNHRRGVAYRDIATSQYFGIPASRALRIRPEARGYPSRDFSRQTIKSQGSRGTTGGRIEREGIQRPSPKSNAFSGIGNGNFERRASERGSSSRQSGGFRGGGHGEGFRR